MMAMSNGVTGGNFATLADLQASKVRVNTKVSLNGIDYTINSVNFGDGLAVNSLFANPVIGTTTSLINSTLPANTGDVRETNGFTSSGDGGGAKWKFTGVTGQTLSQTPAQLVDGLLNDANGNQWGYVGALGVASSALGATNQESNSAPIINAALGGRGNTSLITGQTNILSGISGSKNNLSLVGGNGSQINKTTNGNAITIRSSDSAEIKNLTVNFTNKDTGVSAHGITVVDSEKSTIKNIKFKGVDGLGFGCFMYPDIQATIYAPTIKDTYHEASTTDYIVSNGGAMLVDAEFGLIENTRTKGITRFPVELKGNSTYCIVHNSFIDSSVWGLYYGTQTADHPSYSIASNLIVKGADNSLYSGYGSHNIYNNVIINNMGADGSRIGNNKSVGVKLINAKDSIVSNVLTANDGADLDVPIEISGDSQCNHVQIAPRHSNSEVVTIGVDATRNTVEVLGIKTGNSIFSGSIINYQAANHSGTNGNPVYNHGTGEYWGSLSGKYRWRLEDAVGTSLFSTDRFIFDVPVGLDGRIALTCSDSKKAGFAVITPTQRGELQYRPDFGGWQLSTSGSAYRFYSDSLRTIADSSSSIGIAAARWTELFAANGTINTSDERKKTKLIDITSAEKATALEIKSNIYKFKMLDAIKKKGQDEARVHFGVGAQTVKSIFEKNGLNAHDYSLFCFDEWDYKPAEVGENGECVAKEVEAGDIYGIRYDQLAMFILASI